LRNNFQRPLTIEWMGFMQIPWPKKIALHFHWFWADIISFFEFIRLSRLHCQLTEPINFTIGMAMQTRFRAHCDSSFETQLLGNIISTLSWGNVASLDNITADSLQFSQLFQQNYITSWRCIVTLCSSLFRIDSVIYGRPTCPDPNG